MKSYSKTNLLIAVVLGIFLIIMSNILPGEENGHTQTLVSLTIESSTPTTLAPEAPTINTPAHVNATTVTVRSGESLSTIFKHAGLSPKALHDVVSISPEVAVLNKILPGQILQISTDDNGALLSLEYELSPLKKLTVAKVDTQFQANWHQIEPEVMHAYKTVKITHDNPSLYQAGQHAALSDKLIMELAYIFQWDISFALDLRQGDHFTIIYEDMYVDGGKIKEGDILAARFSHLGQAYTAVQYQDRSGRKDYFTPDGQSLRKEFIRDPVHFSYVSSNFNPKRLHPIRKRVIPHRGIDYAANKGTPVVAVGSGKVTIARQNNASGRYVVIQHGEQYTTKYLHLSAFAKDIKAGKLVQQGQTIGYVGDSGWATGPHLHYEFLVNNVHRNPRTVKLPQAQPISQNGLDQFIAATKTLLTQLNSITSNQVYASSKQATSDGE